MSLAFAVAAENREASKLGCCGRRGFLTMPFRMDRGVWVPSPMSKRTVAMGHAGAPDLDLRFGRCPDAASDASSALSLTRPLVLGSPLPKAASASKSGRASSRLPTLSLFERVSDSRSEDGGVLAGSMLLGNSLTMLLPSAMAAATPLSPVAPSTGFAGAASLAVEPFSRFADWTAVLLSVLG